MNLIGYFIGMFTGHRANGELQQVQQAGEHQGRAFAEAYCTGFESGVVDVFQRRSQRFIGYEPEVVDAEFTVEPKAAKPSNGRKKSRAAR